MKFSNPLTTLNEIYLGHQYTEISRQNTLILTGVFCKKKTKKKQQQKKNKQKKNKQKQYKQKHIYTIYTIEDRQLTDYLINNFVHLVLLSKNINQVQINKNDRITCNGSFQQSLMIHFKLIKQHFIIQLSQLPTFGTSLSNVEHGLIMLPVISEI
jgi:hypothetical protein